jgi:hypothetical protein
MSSDATEADDDPAMLDFCRRVVKHRADRSDSGPQYVRNHFSKPVGLITSISLLRKQSTEPVARAIANLLIAE